VEKRSCSYLLVTDIEGEELIDSLELDAAGYEVEFLTPKETKPAAFARDMEDRKIIIRNTQMTSYCFDYDYKGGTVFLGTPIRLVTA
jgi:hypothetical protein